IGANLLITPEEDTLDVEIGGVNLKPPSDGAFLNEADLPKIKGTFWHNNITGFAPMLPVNVTVMRAHTDFMENETLVGTYFAKQLSYGDAAFTTGVRMTNPWWRVTGAWPNDSSSDILVGERLAKRRLLKTGDEVWLSEPYPVAHAPGETIRVSGILSTGGPEDDEIVAPLGLAQRLLGKPGAVRRVYVSALTKPEDALARRDPKSMSGPIYDRWYCSPYPQSIAFQLQEAIPHSHAEQIRQVAQNEGAVLTRIEGLIFLITLAALFASALAVSAAMATAIFERRAEVGLMKALGAGKLAIASVFFAEATLLALFGGLAGFAAGGLLAHQIGRSIFDSQITIPPVLLPVILSIAVLVTFAGSAAAIRKAVTLDPVFALRGEL
ncbi:MAG: FtsX-like permease family protein, partial [Candidatus Sulfotelmatobacter sp.]